MSYDCTACELETEVFLILVADFYDFAAVHINRCYVWWDSIIIGS